MRSLLVLAIAAVHAIPAYAQQAKRPLDHEVYDSWNDIEDERLSDGGRWITYALVPQEGDAVLHVRSTRAQTAYSVPRGRSARFTDDARFVAFLIKPELAAVRKAKKEKKKPDEQPKDSLGILDLATGDVVKAERVKSFRIPEEGSGWVAYLLEASVEERDSTGVDSTQAREEPEEPEEQEGQEGQEKKKDKKDGTTLILRNLASGAETRFERVTEYGFSEEGAHLAYLTSSEDGSADGAFLVRVANGEVRALLSGEGVYKTLTFAEDGERLAFLSNTHDYTADQPDFAVYHWDINEAELDTVASAGAPGIPAGWWVSEHGDLDFSESGRRLFFGTAPKPAPEPEEETPEWEKVEVDVWNWQDPLLQPMQLVRRDDDLKRSYRAVAHLSENRVVQLADETVPRIYDIADEGDGNLALANSDAPYRQEISWESPRYSDVYVIDIRSGERRKVLERLQGNAGLSPEGRYLTWWDGHQKAWFAMPAAGGDRVNLSAGIPQPVDYQLHDWPMIPRSYGDAGWIEGDRSFLIYDEFDIWEVDPSGRTAPRSITEGFGRRQSIVYRYVRLDPDDDAIPDDEPLLLRAFNERTKAAGFARDQVSGSREPRALVMDERSFGYPRKADDADVVWFTRERFDEFPDVWVSGLDFASPRRMTDANPQMAEYRWGSAELVRWRSSDGQAIQGILYKPEDFDPAKQYPMMVYFYEKMSDGLYSFRSVGPGGSSISVPFYVSRGYLVFIPDVHYRVGYPGESALDCIVPGVLSLVDQGFVEPARIGIQGHSWGGYQIAWMVTRTDLFAAAEAGAPVANMTSAYGGIRWGSGMSRMFQYERSQSRIGGSLWEARAKYIQNSPLFWADRVATPVLMMHNDDDGAVPWYQGIEFFVALRRLNKPVWMLNYNGEPHGLRKYQNRKDWQVRMQQFFDHYLRDAPAPVWLAEGVPAVAKGKTLGLELVETEEVVTGSGRR